MILLTGGSGRLGRELQKYLKCYAPDHRKLDITRKIDWNGVDLPEMIIHCAAYTNLVKAETEKEACFKTNFFGTKNLVDAFRVVPFVYISTEYVYNPVNFYTYTKIEAEKYVKEYSRKFLIIRTLFKTRPFPHDMAFGDQYTRGDYVDVIAPLIVSAIVRWNMRDSRVEDIGTSRKTIYELAVETYPNVQKGSIHDVKEVKLPHDYI